MANIPTVDWQGASGKNYTYYVYSIDYVPAANQDGNYIFAKLVSGTYYPVYIGQGDLQTRKAVHLSDGCVTRKGATHYHCHLNGGEASRKAEESDLLARYTNSYDPTGCNEKIGG